MPQYMITYLGGDQPSSPEEGKRHMSKYSAWLSSLGDAAVSPDNPLKNTSTVNSDGTVTTGERGALRAPLGKLCRKPELPLARPDFAFPEEQDDDKRKAS